MKKKSILMIMYGRQVGGAELQFIELANYLADKNVVRLISLGGDGSIKATSVDSRIDVRIHAYSGKFLVIPALIQAWFEALSFKVDTIITTSVIGSILGYTISIARFARLISLQTVSKSMRYPRLDRLLLKRFDYLVAGAHDIRDYLIGHGQQHDKIIVVHNWVDFSKRVMKLTSSEAKDKFGVSNKFVIGCVGRLHYQKGQLYLIRAFSRLIEQLPQGILLLVGDGPEKKNIELEIIRLGLQDRVLLIGEVSGQDYNDIYGAIDIYVQPSLFEGLPRTLLDAMYFGKAIVASDANGNKEAIDDGKNGLIVSAQDEDGLYNAILNLMENINIRNDFSVLAKEKVISCFEMQNQLEKIQELVV